MIHQYKLGGYNIVLDVCSGAVHAVDDVAYDIIAMFEENTKETVFRTMSEKYPEFSQTETGSITGVYEYGCKLFRKRMECAIMLAVAKALSEA